MESTPKTTEHTYDTTQKVKTLMTRILCVFFALVVGSAWAMTYYINYNNPNGALGASHNAITNKYVVEGDITGYFAGYDATDIYATKLFKPNFEIKEGFSFTTKGGKTNGVQTFAGAWTGSGSFIFGDDDPGKGQTYVFIGDMSGFSGSITRYTITGNPDFTHILTAGKGIIMFGSNTYDVQSYVKTPSDGGSVSGKGAITTAGLLRYQYASGNELFITNSSITARLIYFDGGANYTVTSDLKGFDTDDITNNKILVNNSSSATAATIKGKVTDFGKISLYNYSTLKIESTGTLSFAKSGTIDGSGSFTTQSGATLNLGGASSSTTGLVVTATANISTGTLFDFDSLEPGENLNIKLISASGITAEGWSVANIKIRGKLVDQKGTARFSVVDNVLILNSYNPLTTWNISTATTNLSSVVWSGGAPTSSNDAAINISCNTEVTLPAESSIEAGELYIEGSGTLTFKGEGKINATKLIVKTNTVLPVSQIAENPKIEIETDATLAFSGNEISAGQKFVSGSEFTINGTVKYNNNDVAYEVKNDGLYLLAEENTNKVIVFGTSTYVPNESFIGYIVKIPGANDASYDITSWVVPQRSGNGKVEIGLNASETIPTVSEMAMPRVGERDMIEFGVGNPKPGLYYAVVSADTVDKLNDSANPDASDGVQATNESLSISIVMPEDKVRFFRLRTQLK